MTDTFITLLSTALIMGIAGSGHCMAMCGGITSALGFAAKNNKTSLIIIYSLGRISSYVIAGLLLGSLLQVLPNSVQPVLQIVSYSLLLLVGLYLGHWFNGLLWIESGGKNIWKFIQPLTKKVVPVDTAFKAYLAGAIWGWLPCGLVYSAIAIASSQSDIKTTAAFMLVFGLATLPSMLSLAFFSHKIRPLLQNMVVKRLLAAGVIGFSLYGLITLGLDFFGYSNATIQPHH